MSETSRKPLPYLRLALYLVILGGCGAVAAHELYYAVCGDTVPATILAAGRTPGSLRNARFWAEYEYFDAQQVRHVGRADDVHPTTSRGDVVEVQYLRHDPETSRLAPSPAKWLCFGAVAFLAAVVFVAELAVRWPRRRRARKPPDAARD
jgi:hypothetical protein